MSYIPRSKFIEVSDDGGSLPPPPPQQQPQGPHHSSSQHTSSASSAGNHATSAPSPPGITMSHSWATHDTAGTGTTSGTGGGTASARAAARQQLRHEIAQQRQEVLRRLHETGEIDTVRTQLRSQLIDCGWRDEMRVLVQKAIVERGGVGRVTLEELVEEIKPRSQSAVPENVKSDLMLNVTSFIRKERGEAAPDGVVEVVLRPGMSMV
eukprot:CAMPEP_0181047236 /NCGR_PEP_ID=MMETSP1070-20121207/14771_1 /TAXON_ID=265543 /ORGANISM="Minutocellus polymorphus, Strain NH13" /LENGTH=208 /DNA_ID=CAMNT_0023125893 /DNA_START=6 /DNA_END=632 /DNA_ORIENTATION=+